MKCQTTRAVSTVASTRVKVSQRCGRRRRIRRPAEWSSRNSATREASAHSTASTPAARLAKLGTTEKRLSTSAVTVVPAESVRSLKIPTSCGRKSPARNTGSVSVPVSSAVVPELSERTVRVASSRSATGTLNIDWLRSTTSRRAGEPSAAGWTRATNPYFSRSGASAGMVAAARPPRSVSCCSAEPGMPASKETGA